MKYWTLIILVNGAYIHFGQIHTSLKQCTEEAKKIEQKVNPGDTFDYHCFEDRIEKKI